MTAEQTVSGELVEGRYRLVRVLGRGGQAAVWRALDLETNAEVALKLLHASRRADPAAVQRLGREAEMLRRLEHPQIARCLDFRLDLSRPYIAMEYVRGVSLAQELSQRAPRQAHFSLGEVREIFEQLLGAVGHAHELAIMHRDLKPPNVMFIRTEDGVSTKLLDLGVAKLLDQGIHDETTQGRVLGSILYMSPEQATGLRVDERTDIFALGTILFEVLSLRRAWTRLDDGTPPLAYVHGVHLRGQNAPTEILKRIVAPERPAPSRWRSGVGRSLDAVVARALAVRPEDRYPRAVDLQEALDAAIEEGAARTRLTILSDWSADGREPSSSPGPGLDGAWVGLSEEDLARARLVLGATMDEGAVLTRTAASELSHAVESTPSPTQGTSSAVSPRPARRVSESKRSLFLGLTVALAATVLAFGLSQVLVREAPPRVVLEAARMESSSPRASTPRVRAESEEDGSLAAGLEPPRAEPSPAPGPAESEALRPVSRVTAPTKRSPAPGPQREPVKGRREEGRFSEIRAALARLASEGSNLDLFNRTGQAVIKAADARVSSAERRGRIKRLASSSMRTADLAQLQRAVAELESAAD